MYSRARKSTTALKGNERCKLPCEDDAFNSYWL